MSWAKDDPEGWMKVCRIGVTKKLEMQFEAHIGGAFSDTDTGLVCLMLVSLHDGDTEAQKIWDALTTWANEEIIKAEASYLSEKE